MDDSLFATTVISATSAIAGSIIASTAAIFATNHANRGNKELLKAQLSHDLAIHHERTITEKREELYVLAAEYTNSLVGHMLPYIPLSKGEISYDSILDMVIDTNDSKRPNFPRLQMLVDLYVPEVSDELKKLLAARDNANKIRNSIVESYKMGDTDEPGAAQAMSLCIRSISQAGEDLRDAITELTICRNSLDGQ